MNKETFKIKLLILFILILPSCYPPLEEQKCAIDDDCGNRVCINGVCQSNYCLDWYIECGKGKCIPMDESYKCNCDDDAILYKDVCVPRCNGFSLECRELFKNKPIMRECNMNLGHCDNYCYGKDSCEEGYYCIDGGSCSFNEYPCENNDDCKDNTDYKTVCNLEYNTCRHEDGYCLENINCQSRKDNKTICNLELKKCDYPEIYCIIDEDCENSPNGKTICNTELKKCEEK